MSTTGFTLGWFFVSKVAKLIANEDRTDDFRRPFRFSEISSAVQLWSPQSSPITTVGGADCDLLALTINEHFLFFREEFRDSLAQA